MRRIPSDEIIDRLPPHSIEAEQGVLGCVMLSPNESMGQCLDMFKTGSEAFYDLRNRTIYEALVEMYDARQPIDSISLQQRLHDHGELEGVGGRVYLSTLPDSVPSAANLEYYLGIVREKYLLRRMITLCTEVVGRAYDHEGDVHALLDQIERDILSIGQDFTTGMARTMKQLVREAIEAIDARHTRGAECSGLSTGFIDFDKMTDGLHGGEVIVIAARPSLGKTSLAMNIAEHVALELRLPVGIFSLEMTAQSLVTRMLCSCAHVNIRNVRDGFLAERDFPRLTGAAGKLAGAPIYIDDSAGLSVIQLRAKARRMVQQGGVKLFVVDYVQLLHSTNKRADSREREIADISAGIKALAKELDVPIVVLSQLNRKLEESKRKPRLSDLRESGAIEQDADLVGLLYHPTDDHDGDEVIPTNLLIAKQRNGPTGDVALTFLRMYTRFESAAKICEEETQRSMPYADS